MRNTKNMHHLFAAFLIFLLAFLLSTNVLADTVNGHPKECGTLHLQGIGLQDENGAAVVLRGVSLHGLTYFPGYIDAELFETLSQKWDANVVRLPVYPESYCNDTEEKVLQLCCQGIEAAVNAGMYVIVDWHILEANELTLYADGAELFFDKIAKQYASCPNILYEICNEPSGDTTWQDIKKYAGRIIPVIKQYNPDAIIICGTPDYSSDLDAVTADPITGWNNVMYSFHFYASSRGDSLRQILQNALNNSLPVFISECGLTESDGTGTINYEACTAWFEFVEEKNLSLAIWNLSNAEESSAMVKSYVTHPGTLQDKDLTACGQYAKALLTGTAPQNIPEMIHIDFGFAELWYGNAIVPFLVFASGSICLMALFFFLRKLNKKSSRNYNELLKRTGSASRANSKKRIIFGKIALILSTLTSLIYLCWRVAFSVPTDSGILAVVCNLLLLVVEILGFGESLIHYASLSKLRNYPLPEVHQEEYPPVDIFVATYNEPSEVLRKTLIGCKHMRYPDKSKVHIYLCDDNRRQEMRALAEELGVNYFDRPDNSGAKAGNLNCAMARTDSPYIVTFDADMIPQEDFLLRTIPYFVDAQRRNSLLPLQDRMPLGFIQTPQCFYNPDVFQHNLYAEKRIPNEQDFFYRTIEPARTASNSVIYGGSNTVLSRDAINAIGGFYTGSITEDFATGLLIEAAGFISLGLPEPLASGLAPSSFKEHIQQRTRWGRGVILTAKKLKFLRNKNLKIAQKASYLSSVTYWFSSVKNWIYILAPLMFAVFGIPVFKCTFHQMLIFWLPMFICQNLCLRLISSGSISSKWSGIQETVVMPFLLVPILKESLGISLSTFKVTKKQISIGKRQRNAKAMIPFFVLSLFSLFGITRVIYFIVKNRSFGLLAVLFWLVRNLYFLIMCLFLIDGRDSDGENVCVKDAEPVCVMTEVTHKAEGITTKLTEHSINFFIDDLDYCKLGQTIDIGLRDWVLHGTVVSVRKSQHPNVPAVYTVEILDYNGHKDAYIYHLYNRIPTLPQSLKRDLGLLPDLWVNLVRHTADKVQ